MQLFLFALVFVCGASALIGGARLMGTAAVLLGNYAACWVVANYGDTAQPWLCFLLMDYVSALILLASWPPSRWQLAIAALYALQIVAHGAFALTGPDPWSSYHYWHTLNVTAWAQLAVMAVWGAYELGRRGSRNRGGVSRSKARHAGAHGITGSQAER